MITFARHRVRTSHIFNHTLTRKGQWKSLKFDPDQGHHLKSTEPMHTKNLNGRLRRGCLHLYKISYDSIRKFPLTYTTNVHSASFWVLPTRYPKGRCTYFDAQCIKRHPVAQWCAFWRYQNECFYILTHFLPKNGNFGLKFRRLKSSIHRSWMLDRQIDPQKLKCVGIFYLEVD